MNKEFVPKPLKITADMEGISLKAISEHYKLYEGYVKKTNYIREKLKQANRDTADIRQRSPFFKMEYDEMRRQESFIVNGVKLHEIYFGILGGDGKPKGKIAEAIGRDFINSEEWTEDMRATVNSNEMVSVGLGEWVVDMKAAASSARGWVITAYDIDEGRIRNYSADAHNIGIVAGTIPLIALDVYEHAYFMDHGTNRSDYVAAFFKNLDWAAIDEMAEGKI
jgi:Fe-Mn family superoxide dismutase